MKHLVCVAALSVCATSAWAAQPAYWAEWIKSNGSQGIILPVKGSANLTYEVKAAWVERQNAAGLTVLGCEDQTDSTAVISYVPFCFANTRRWSYVYGTSGYVLGCNTEPFMNVCALRTVLKDGDQQFSWGGTTYTTGTLPAPRDIDVSFGLFARYCKKANGTFGFANHVCIYLYWVKIYDADDKLVFDGKPCMNELGMGGVYDSVTDQIYYADGGKNFVVGPTYRPGERSVKYVAPVAAGTGDGTSWANASGDVGGMIRGVCFNPLGGEVHVKKGVHALTTNIELGPNVIVRGGYAGLDDDEEPTGKPEETVVTGADCTQTWLGDGVDTGVLVVDAVNGWLNPPPVAANPTVKAWYPSAAGTAFSLYKTSGALTNATVSGLTFALAPSGAFSVTTSEADGFVVSNCVFAGCVPTAVGVTFNIANSAVVVSDCAFYGNGTALMLHGTTRDATMTVRDCLFSCNHYPATKDKNYNGSAVSTENASVNLLRCRFEHNVSDGPEKGVDYAIVYLGTIDPKPLRTVRVTDCVFTNNQCSGKSAGVLVIANNVNVNARLAGCHFAKNRGRPCLNVDCPGGSTKFRVWDSLFTDNAIDSSDGSYGTVFSIYFHHRYSVEFVNCEFARNLMRGASADACHTMRLVKRDRPTNLSIVNCLFRDNDVFVSDGTTDTRASEIDWNRTAYSANVSAAFVNTIFTHTNTDYVALTPHTDEIYANCYLQGTDITSLGKSNNGWHADDLTFVEGAPGLSESPVVAANDNIFDILDAASPIRRCGRKVYLGTDGYCYLYHEAVGKTAARWQSLKTDSNTPLKYLTLAEGAALGLDVNNPSIADARGKARPRKVSPGPVDFGVPGMVLLVR